jgi:hypothetical protein
MYAITLIMARLAYACVLTRDLERVATFYREVLQADPEWTGPYAEFPTSGGIFSLWSVDAYGEIAGTAAIPQASTSTIAGRAALCAATA